MEVTKRKEKDKVDNPWLELVEKPVEEMLLSVNQSLRTFTHEAWQYGSQLANGTSLFLLG